MSSPNETSFICLCHFIYFQNLLATDLGYTIDNAQGPEGQKIKDDIQQDYLKMDIFYQTLNVKSISQSAKYPVSFKECVMVGEWRDEIHIQVRSEKGL